MDLPWRIQLFGGLRAERGGNAISRFRTQKMGALLAYLAFHRGRTHPREVLIETIWPGIEPAAGCLNLRVALHSLRRSLEPPGVPKGAVLRADRASVTLNPDSVETDVEQFEAAIESAGRAGMEAEKTRRLEEAVELYRGELLPGYSQDWVTYTGSSRIPAGPFNAKPTAFAWGQRLFAVDAEPETLIARRITPQLPSDLSDVERRPRVVRI